MIATKSRSNVPFCVFVAGWSLEARNVTTVQLLAVCCFVLFVCSLINLSCSLHTLQTVIRLCYELLAELVKGFHELWGF